MPKINKKQRQDSITNLVGGGNKIKETGGKLKVPKHESSKVRIITESIDIEIEISLFDQSFVAFSYFFPELEFASPFFSSVMWFAIRSPNSLCDNDFHKFMAIFCLR